MTSIDPIYSVCGFFVALLVGQTGVGGGSLMTPLLILGFGIPPAVAVGTDLLYAAATNAVGTLVHGRNKTVDWRITLRLAGGSIPTAFVTLLALSHFGLAHNRSSTVISAVLGVALILTAIALVFRGRILSLAGTGSEAAPHPRTAVLTVVIGVAIGFLVSISSVGAGALGVTSLILLYPWLKLSRIVGSDIAHAVPLTLLAGLGHWTLGSVDPTLLVSLLLGSVPGIVVGSQMAAKVPDVVLRPIVATVLLFVGGRLIF
jgi:uncharacterized membrane protein YfcA